MKPSSLIAVLVCAWLGAACSSGSDGPGSDAASNPTSPSAAASAAAGGTGSFTPEARIDALTKSGVPMPGSGVEAVDPVAIAAASQAAAAETGSRGVFQEIHDTVVPLRPTGGLRLASLAPTEICVGVDGAPLPCPGGGAPGGGGGGAPGGPAACPRVCATACASANATAVAAAFAHASAQACAFAQAWACVYESTPPFNRVCAWARSQSCVSTFATAFGFGFATANDQECRMVCSDGTVTVTRGPGAPNLAPPAANSLLRPDT